MLSSASHRLAAATTTSGLWSPLAALIKASSVCGDVAERPHPLRFAETTGAFVAVLVPLKGTPLVNYKSKSEKNKKAETWRSAQSRTRCCGHSLLSPRPCALFSTPAVLSPPPWVSWGLLSSRCQDGIKGVCVVLGEHLWERNGAGAKQAGGSHASPPPGAGEGAWEG